ncbi:MAG: condensation domain-containing protein, partial [Tumebacillaceae bacterium]
LHAKVDELQMVATDRIAQNSSQCVDISIWQLFSVMLVGGCVHILPDDVAFDPYRQIEAIAALQLTIVETVPTLLRSMLDEIARVPQKPDFSALRWMIPNGEALPPELCRRWLHEYPSVPLINAYGPTECSDDVTHFFISEPPAEQVVTTLIGRALPNVRLYVLDQHLQPVPIGVMGELYVGGLVVGRGYLNNPEKTAAAFLQDPFSAEAGARLYRTGDYARYLEDGNLDFMGRVDHQVKINGMRIELGEIEAALTDHAELEHVIVVDRLDEQGNKRLVAYMICAEGQNPSAAELRSFLSSTLPKHMVPSAFVQLQEFPLTLNGKIDRKRLPEPIFEEVVSETAYIAPVSDAEIKMTRIWQDVLGVERIGLQDRFFDLGGHSLQAIQLLSVVRREFGREVALRDLFEQSTPAGLLAVLGNGKGEEAPLLVPIERDGLLVTSFFQERLWNTEKAFPMPFLYNVPIAFTFRGQLQPEALRQAVQELITRHDSLRMVFTEVEGMPYQVVLPELACPWRTEDLSMLEESVQRQELRERELQEGGQVFDLFNGPLVSNLLVRLSEEEHVLILTMHHNISDGWSVKVILEELADLYPHFAHGTPRRRPALNLQYADYAKWHRDWLEQEGMTSQLAYWATQLSGDLPVYSLPVDRPKSEHTGFLGKTLINRLPEELVHQLAALSQQAGCTLFMTMFASYLLLLHRYGGQEDIVVGVPSTNRSHPDLQSMIGLIVNLLPIRADLSGNPTFAELLQRVRQVSVGAFANQDYPVERLLEVLQPERKKKGIRLYQTTFSYENNRSDGTAFSPGLTCEVREIRSEMSRGDFVFIVSEDDLGMEVMFEFKSGMFDDETIQRLLEEMQRMLESIVADPALTIDQLVRK